MGKKGTKRKTRWRTLPLGEDEPGSGNEEELFEEDTSTTSSIVGQASTFRVHPPVFRMGEKSYRPQKRFPYDRFRSKEPLIKLESKTFDEEEYTKITTPRQDVLFKKGYFGRKRESSAEETVPSSGDADGEEPMMDQYIITNGFLDERGHYYVNGSSYEVYDPYSNTVTVVVGPPPYTNGVSQPVLAAVSCQPVPLTPVEWYPPGSDWPTHGSAWTPSFAHGDHVQNGDTGRAFNGHDSQIPSLYQQPAFFVPGYVYSGNSTFNAADGTPFQNCDSEPGEIITSKEDETDAIQKNKQKSEITNEVEDASQEVNENSAEKPGLETMAQVSDDIDSNHALKEEPKEMTEKTGMILELDIAPGVRLIEKQSHSTQTNSSETEIAPRVRIKESHSTQTVPEEAVEGSREDETKIEAEVVKKEVSSKSPTKLKAPPRQLAQNDSVKRFCQRKFEDRKPKLESKSTESFDSGVLKTSYAKKLLNGLEEKIVNGTTAAVCKTPSDYSNAQTVMVRKESDNQTKTNYTGKRLNNDKCVPTENKRNNNRIVNGNVRNGYERQAYKANSRITDKVTDHGSDYKEKKTQGKCVKPGEPMIQEVDVVTGDSTIIIESVCYSEKSSTVSELSSPTDLSSGQNTPPEKLIVQKMEQKLANDLNKSFEEKLKQNLPNKEEENEEDVKQSLVKLKQQPKKKIKAKQAEEPKEKPRTSRSKRKKKNAEDRANRTAESEEFVEENLFFHLYSNSQDFLSKAWENMNKEKVEPIPDFESILSTENDEILETLGIVEKLNVPKLPLASDLLLFPRFGHERPKLKFEDFFAAAALKELQGDMFTKSNITNMRSTKPEEFFASIVENPLKEHKKYDKKENSKVGKKSGRTAEGVDIVKKKSGSKAIKEKDKEPELKVEKEDKKNELVHEEAKLGIMDAVSSWLQEQGDPEKVLSFEALKQLKEDEEEDEEIVDNPDQKNGLGNPIHALSVEECHGFGDDRACIRVANISKDDGYVGTETTAKNGETLSRLYRSSSWDAKLSHVQIKKHFRFLTEASSWDRRKLKDVVLKKHLKFITDSAHFCHDLFGDVENGYEFAREELCDPMQSVSKYYTLSPSILDSFDKSIDCEGEAFDALDYKFLGRDGGRGMGSTGNLHITDSGVHSDTESIEDATTATSDWKYPLPNKEVCCKMQ